MWIIVITTYPTYLEVYKYKSDNHSIEPDMHVLTYLHTPVIPREGV